MCLGIVFDPDLNCCLEGCDGACRGHCVGDLIPQSDGGGVKECSCVFVLE